MTVDASSGLITIGDKQEGGDVKITGESDDKATALGRLPLYEKPTKISATSGSAASTGARYQADFKHTFEGHSGKAAKTEGTHVDEKFDSTTAEDPVRRLRPRGQRRRRQVRLGRRRRRPR